MDVLDNILEFRSMKPINGSDRIEDEIKCVCHYAFMYLL